MFEQMTIAQYNEILASKAPTPGGGSALAVVGTIACSLVEMSANVTLTKLNPQVQEFEYRNLQNAAVFFARARQRLSKLADDDAEAFRRIIDCMHMPKDTDEQKALRKNQLQKAYHKAALVPLDVMTVCKEALHHAKMRVLPVLYEYVKSDCVIGTDLFAAIIKNSLQNVYANTNLIVDSALRTMLEQQGESIVEQANKLV